MITEPRAGMTPDAPGPRTARSLVRWPGTSLVALAVLAGALPARAADPAPVTPMAPATPAAALPVVLGKVTRVNDGDSIEVDTLSGHARVRFSAVDTPEYDQPYGDKSSAALKAMLPVGSDVELEVVSQDSFHRLVATVFVRTGGERINVNERMLHDGHAWAYRRYMKDPRFCDIEAEARDAKRGLWAQPVSDWVYPPEWRFLRNGEIRSLPAPYPETRATCIAVLKLAGAATYAPPN